MPNHNEVAHAWANQTGRHRKGFNVFYEGDTIYSYGHHFPIARLVQSPHAGRVVLFTTEGYSVSTAKHKTFTRRAIGHLTTFDVPNVRANREGEHGANWQAFVERASASIQKAKRARTYKDMHLRHATGAVSDANAYAVAFGLDRLTVTMETLEPTIADLTRIAREQAERDAVAVGIRNRQAQREQRAAVKPIVRAWLKGENDPYAGGRMHSIPRPLCRVKGDTVETSWGASVPLLEALALFRLATMVRRSGKPLEFPPGLGRRMVGDFPLTRIGVTGNIVVGCHDIPYRFAKLAADLAGLTI